MVTGSLCYLDSSAIVKLVIPEPETDPLLAFLRANPRQVTNLVATVEVLRAVARRGGAGLSRALEILASLDAVDLDRELARAAAALEPVSLRTLDAIHLATALALGDDLAAVVTYDHRLKEAAQAAGLSVVSPS